MSNKRFVIFTNGNFFAKVILERVFEEYRDYISGVLIITGDYKGRVGFKSLWELCQQMAFPYLLYKIITILAFKLIGKLMPNRIYDVSAMARHYNIPFWHFVSVKSPEVLNKTKDLVPDILISVSCPQLIGRNILGIPKLGSINIHSSSLPAYAGLAPYYWVLTKPEKYTSTTVHIMTPKFDEGNILVQKELQIMQHESAFHLFKRLSLLGRDALVEGIHRMLSGDSGVQQDTANYSYYSNPTLESYLKLCKNGHKLIRINELWKTMISSH